MTLTMLAKVLAIRYAVDFLLALERSIDFHDVDRAWNLFLEQ